MLPHLSGRGDAAGGGLAGGNRLGSCVAPARRRVGQRLGYAGRGLADKKIVRIRVATTGWRESRVAR